MYHWDQPFGSHISFPLNQTPKMKRESAMLCDGKSLKTGKLDEIRSDKKRMENQNGWICVEHWHTACIMCGGNTKDSMCVMAWTVEQQNFIYWLLLIRSNQPTVHSIKFISQRY